jgi:hypothetical protein
VENSFEKTEFKRGEKLVIAAFLIDQITGSTLNMKIINPSGVSVANVSRTMTEDFYSSYWYWTLTVNPNSPIGKYTLRATYETQVVDYSFAVVGTSAVADENVSSHWISQVDQNIVLDLEHNESVIISDLLGRKIMHLDAEDSSKWLSLSQGFYVATLLRAGQIITSKKLIKR